VYPPGLWEGPSDRRWVSLTFDDGPDPEMTLRILEALRRAQAPGTFFLVGNRAEEAPDLVRRIQGEGHEIGNHTWNHKPLLGPYGSPHQQLSRTEELLERLAPGSPRIFRPPFGAIGPGGSRALARQGLLPVYWSVVPADWDPLTPEQVSSRVLSQVHPGAVVVLHGGRTWHAGTAYGLERLVEEIRARDYELVPVSRMLAASGYAPGAR
jgi:peptidoglycan/xylan/chitin deacetylase (PgdA/CDA1 family)